MSAVAVIELEDPDQLIAHYGSETFALLSAEVKARLERWVRNQDQLVVEKSGRICVLLRGVTDEGQIHLAANKLQKITAPAHNCFGETVKLKLSAGFTLAGHQQDSKYAALARASAALNHARQQQRFYALYHDDLPSRAADQTALLDKLQNALTRGEFSLYFQPKVNAAFRNLVGAEALIRWLPPTGEVVSPGAFMGVAEQHPIIHPMTEWIIKSAVARCARWQGEVGVAVNVPPNVIQGDNLLNTVKDSLELYDLAPQRLTLEVTENIMAEDPSLLFAKLAQLRELGVRIALDDFGTGYSSFAYFRALPADELKIDQVFVKAMSHSKVDAAIIKSIVDLAKNFSLSVVAEGVEDDTSADALRDLGCDTLQGYLFDKPLAAEDFEKRHQL